LAKLGLCGCGSDVYDITSSDKIPIKQYKLVIFTCVEGSPETLRLIKQCRQSGVSVFFVWRHRGNARYAEKLSELIGIEPKAEQGGQPELLQKTVGASKTWYYDAPDPDAAILRKAIEESGVHMYADTGDVVYANRNFLCIHAATAGVKHITLPEPATATEFLGSRVFSGKEFDADMKQYETLIFRLQY